MAKASLPNQFDIGFVGLDCSGRQLACTVAAQHLSVVAYDHNRENVKALRNEAPAMPIHFASSLKQLIGQLRPRRTIVASGPEANLTLFNDLLEQLEEGDLLIDAADCHFRDCCRRARRLAERDIHHLGLGIIGGWEEEGARRVHLVGGHPDTFLSVLSTLESLAGKPEGGSPITFLGSAAAGHFVKMIHDGIEHTLMQLSRETFDVLKRALVLEENELRDATRGWKIGARKYRPCEDCARWTFQTAHELEAPTPTIAAAVGMRILSEFEKRNDMATTPFRQPMGHFDDDPHSILNELHGALSAANIIAYAQGIAILVTGSERYGFEMDPAEVIRLWQDCNKVRAGLLDDIALALRVTPNLPNLLDDDDLSEKVMEHQESLRHAVWRANLMQTPAPALTASLDYLDSYRGAWLPANLIQTHNPFSTPQHPAALGRR
jgi:6-phosphogluconate dehydrogenase